MVRYSISLLAVIFCLAIPYRNAVADPHRYEVRGIIRTLPAQGSESREIMIRHEEIPNYVDISGAVVGMRAMTMPFEVSQSVALSEFKVGDEVQFELHSSWDPKPQDLIVQMQKLPPGSVTFAATSGEKERAGH